MRKVIYAVLLFFIQGYLFSQSFQWVKQIGGSSSDNSQAIALDASGNVFTAGYFQGTADFDPGPGVFNLTSSGSDDIFISKLDASGNFLWAKRVGGTNSDICQYLSVDPSGNVLLTGSYLGNVDFNPGAATFILNSLGNKDVYILKLDGSGNFVWAKQLGGNMIEEGSCITTDLSGNVYTIGVFNSIGDFDPGPGNSILVSSGLNDIFISKLDASGNFVWARKFGGGSDEFGNSITVDAAGLVYTTGRYLGTCDFDPGSSTANHTPLGGSDVFVSKLDASGNYIWSKSFGGTGTDVGYAINTDPLGGVYVSGWFIGTADFDPAPSSYTLSGGNFEAYLSKLDAAGNFVWAKQLGGSLNDAGQSVALDAQGNIFTTGYFQGTADFDPGPGTINMTSAGAEDVFINKLDASGNLLWVKQMGGTGLDIGTSIVWHGSGVLYTTGYFNATADFDPGATSFSMTSSGSNDAFIHKIQSCAGAPAAPSFINGPSNVCGGSTHIYSVTPVAGYTYTWTLSSGWSGSSSTNTISINSGSQNGTVSVMAGNICGTSSSQTLAVTVFTSVPSAPVSISGNTLVCSGSSNVYAVSTQTDATSYNWMMPAGWSGSSVTNSVTTIVNSNNGTVTVSAINVCGNSLTQTLSVYINTIQITPSPVTGNTAICAGTSNIYSVGVVSGATSYTWNFPLGWSGSSSTNSITLTSGLSSGNVSVIAGNSCANSIAQSLSVTVTNTPSIPTAIAGSNNICAGTSNNYSVFPVSNATSYVWNLPGGWTGSSVTNTINTIAGLSGTISVIASNFCGSSGSQSLAISVNTVPTMPGSINGSSVICSGASVIYSISPVIGASSYSWTFPSGWNGSGSSNTINIIPNQTGGVLSVSAINSCGNSLSQTLSVIVYSTPASPSIINGNTIICSGTTSSYSVTLVPGAFSYFWVFPNGWTGSSNSNSIILTAGTTGGTISVIAGNPCFNSLAQTLNLNVIPSPTVNISSSHTLICNNGQSATLTAGGANTYTWNTGTPGNSIIITPSVTTVYSVTAEGTNGCQDTLSFNQVVSDCVGLNDYSTILQGANIFPNPFLSKLKISIPSDVNAIVKVNNALGQIISELKMEEKETEFDLSDYPAGIYLFTLKVNNNYRTFRMIKQ